MADPELEVWEAVRFERGLRTGRTKPLLLECAHIDGDTERRGRFVTKALGLPEVHEFSLCHEFLGCRLARLFGLIAPESVLVDLSPAFLDAVRADLEREQLNVHPGLAVGVEHIRNLLAFPSKASLGEGEVVQAARIYTFDLAVQNPDRTTESPNCGRAAEGLMPYDFENAFSFRLAIAPPPPWQVARLPFCRRHLFYGQLRHARVDWTSALASMRAVPTREVERVCGTLPKAWQSMGLEIRDHVVAVIARWPDFEAEVAASLL